MSAGPDRRPIWTAAEAVARLATSAAVASGDVGDFGASLDGPSGLALRIDGPDPPAPTAAALGRACAALSRLACPTYALGGEALDAGDWRARLAARCDVALPDEDAFERLTRRLAATPLAALAWVQLLRQNEVCDPHRGLVNESLVYATLQAGPEFARWLAGRSDAPSPDDAGPPVRVTRDGDRLEVVLCRPDRHNALSAAMRDGLVEALAVAAADDTVERVVLRGEGASFCSGGELAEFGSAPDPATAHAVRSERSPARALLACADRVRAELHGACVGAGIELPAFAAEVVAARDAWFRLPEIGMGLVPGAGGSVSLPRRIGRQRTAWLALSGERIDAETALRWGLVDRIA